MELGLETIKKRSSVRSYAEQKIEPEALSKLEELCRSYENAGPFGARVRFKLVNLESLPQEEWRSMSTYGVIKGARNYILGAVRYQNGAMEDLGYCLEMIILHATLMGLGTCWLGGTFRRSAFASRMNLAADELLPAVTPVGYPTAERSVTERLMRVGAGSKNRKPWAALFFKGDMDSPLAGEDAGAYRDAFEAVRLGPSASNRQPWRLVKDRATGEIHLFLSENKIYNRMMGKIRFQNVDMGIAMCHFEVVARESGLPGKWVTAVEAPQVKGLKHIASWR